MTSHRRDDAFSAAARTRELRAEYRAEVEAGTDDLETIFARADRDPVIGSMKLLPLLEALPEVGKVRSRRALGAAGIAETARAGSVDAARRSALGDALAAQGHS
jgi:hypothetical protein